MTRRSLTLVSARRFCRVCDGLGRVRVVRLLDPPVGGRGQAACPHCAAGRAATPVPIYVYPLREERPSRGGDAA